MGKDDKNVYDAKKAVKGHIKFFGALLKHLNGADNVLKGRAMWAAWCLDRYINNTLGDDIKRAISDHTEDSG